MAQVKSLQTGIKFKDTPIGKIPVDWESGPFSNIAEINPKRNLKKGNIYLFVEMAAISAESHRVQYSSPRKFEGGGSKFQNKDTIFARITPCIENGKTAYIDFLKDGGVGHGSTEFIILGPKETVAAKFIYYCAKWDKVRNIAIPKMEGTSGRQRVPSRVFSEDIYVPIPPLPEQKKIADILTTVDNAIEETDRIIEKTKELKKGLMQKLLTRGIGQKRFKKTEIGEIPKGWKIAKLKDVSTLITSGSRGWAKYYSDSGPLFLRIGNLTRDHINLRLREITHVALPDNVEGIRATAEEGDLLISITADLGIIGLIPSKFGEAYVNQHIALVKIKSSIVNPRWLAYFLSGDAGQRQFQIFNDAGSKAGLNLNTIASLIVAIPKKDEQNQIASILSEIDADISYEQNHKASLETLKKSLMQVLLTGRVRVKLH